MMTIEWGDLRPTAAERDAIERQLARAEATFRSTVYLRNHGSGCEARLRVPVAGGSTELRLHGEDASAALARLLELLAIVEHERTRAAA